MGAHTVTPADRKALRKALDAFAVGSDWPAQSSRQWRGMVALLVNHRRALLARSEAFERIRDAARPDIVRGTQDIVLDVLGIIDETEAKERGL